MKKITYDAQGQVDEAIEYLYDGYQVIAEYDGEGNLLRKFVYGNS